MLPLNNAFAKRSNKDCAIFNPGEERLLKRYLGEAGLDALPATLDEYVGRMVDPTLERHKRDGAVADGARRDDRRQGNLTSARNRTGDVVLRGNALKLYGMH